MGFFFFGVLVEDFLFIGYKVKVIVGVDVVVYFWILFYFFFINFLLWNNVQVFNFFFESVFFDDGSFNIGYFIYFNLC